MTAGLPMAQCPRRRIACGGRGGSTSLAGAALAVALLASCAVSVGDPLDAESWCPFVERFQEIQVEQSGVATLVEVIDHLDNGVPDATSDDLKNDVRNVHDFYVNVQAGEARGDPFAEREAEFENLIDVPLAEFQTSVNSLETVTQDLCGFGFDLSDG